jgi:hypothetical protein
MDVGLKIVSEDPDLLPGTDCDFIAFPPNGMHACSGGEATVCASRVRVAVEDDDHRHVCGACARRFRRHALSGVPD